MKITSENFKKGFATLTPQTPDDLWHLSHIIEKGDIVKGKTTRKIKKDDQSDAIKRTLILISKLEKKHKNKKILLVSHGDVLQILHTHVSGKPVGHHRLIPHLETAEIRELSRFRYI